MTPGSHLAKALQAVDWPNNVAIFVNSRSLLRRLALCNYRIAVWAKQLVSIDAQNPAISFVHEMQQAGFYAAALAGLALYKPAAGAIRTAVETALYYTYFRSHPAELATLARSTGYFMSRKDLLEYHKIHSRGFAHAKLFNQPSRFVVWYSTFLRWFTVNFPGNGASLPLWQLRRQISRCCVRLSVLLKKAPAILMICCC